MQKGFIALLTVIIVSAILLALVSTAGMAAFFSRFSVVGYEQRQIALALAQGCERLALLQLAENYSYDPAADPSYVAGKGVPESDGVNTCYIKDSIQLSETAASRVVQLDTWAQDGNAFASVAMTAEIQNNSAPQKLVELDQ